MACEDASKERNLETGSTAAMATDAAASESGHDVVTSGVDVFSWKKELYAGVLEGLRRHAHYLETSWHGLSSVKLLYDTYRYGIPFEVSKDWTQIGIGADGSNVQYSQRGADKPFDPLVPTLGDEENVVHKSILKYVEGLASLSQADCEATREAKNGEASTCQNISTYTNATGNEAGCATGKSLEEIVAASIDHGEEIERILVPGGGWLLTANSCVRGFAVPLLVSAPQPNIA